MRTQWLSFHSKVDPIYLRVSMEEQDLARQAGVEESAGWLGIMLLASTVKKHTELTRIWLSYRGRAR